MGVLQMETPRVAHILLKGQGKNIPTENITCLKILGDRKTTSNS